MRTLVRWTVPAGAGNTSVENGAMKNVLESLARQLKPEAAYFLPQDGLRAGLMVFDMKDPSEVAIIAEQLFEQLEANVSFSPVMNADDLQRALQKIAG